MKYSAICSFTAFYITCMSYVSITDKIAKPKIFPTFFCYEWKIWCLALKINFSHEKLYSWFHCFEFFLVQTSAKLRNSQIFENCQLWYSLNYSNFFQVFVLIFEKLEEHIIWKMFSKFMEPVISTGWEKNAFAKFFYLFLKWKCYCDISIQ